MEKLVSTSMEEVNQTVNTFPKGNFLKRLLAFSGPAYMVSVGYMDPGNWATDIAGGSKFGYQLLWVLIMSNIMAVVLQSLSARLGIVTQLDLAQASRAVYSKVVNYSLFSLAQLAIIACDLAEVLGFAIGFQLLFGFPLLAGILISLFDTFLILLLQKFGIRKLEAFLISLVIIIGVCFGIEIFMANPNWVHVLGGAIPQPLSGSALLIAIGIIGATVMPHNLYLHSSLVQTRKIPRTFSSIKSAIRFNFIDSVIALNLAFFVNAAILILAASAFFYNNYKEVASIVVAHKLLEPLLGSYLAPILFAVALIASGQSSTITGTIAGQIIMEGYLHIKLKPWIRRLLTRSLAIIPAVITLLIFGESNIEQLLIISQVILSLQLGFAIVPLIHLNSNKLLMQKFVMAPWLKILSWAIAAIIIFLNIKLVIDNVISTLTSADYVTKILIYGVALPIILAAVALLIYIIFKPINPSSTIAPITENEEA
jgi:manganese transport protein